MTIRTRGDAARAERATLARLLTSRELSALAWGVPTQEAHSRVRYVERLASEGADACAGLLARALAFFADHGVRVRQVMTDNAFSYRYGRLWRAVRLAWGIEHLRTPKYTPEWNGKVEAAVGILLREWAYARPYLSNRAREIAFAHFVHSYNHRRPHGELGGLTPMQRLTADVNNVRGQHS